MADVFPLKHLAKKVEREKIVLAALPELSMRIIEHPREQGRVAISDIIRLTGTNRYIEATLPSVGRRRPSWAPRQRTRRVVRIALRKRRAHSQIQLSPFATIRTLEHTQPGAGALGKKTGTT
jgi:hypothetical protein